MGNSGGTDQNNTLFMSNRWAKSLYTGYGLVKQRVFMQLLQQCKEQILAVGNGFPMDRFDFLKTPDQTLPLALDISKISHYNNYYLVRKHIKEMCTSPVHIYSDPTFKSRQYHPAQPLFLQHKPDANGIVWVRMRKEIAELLLHVDTKKISEHGRTRIAPKQYTSFDRNVIDRSSSKYMYPLYTMICSWAGNKGVTVTMDELRARLQVEDKYKDTHNLIRFVLRHIQKELDIFGKYCFNFTTIKTGRTITGIQFKIWENKKAADLDHIWLQIQRALRQELPYFMRITDDQREELNYLFTGNYDLDAVYRKLHYVHKLLVKKKENNERTNDVFAYLLIAIHNDFPPDPPT